MENRKLTDELFYHLDYKVSLNSHQQTEQRYHLPHKT